MSQLFRQEAITRQGEKIWGDCVDLHPLARGVLCAILLLIVAIAALFLIKGEYQRKETVQGVLVPDKGAVTIRMPADGIVEELLAGQDDRVGKGNTLLVIDTGMTRIDGVPLVRRMLDENFRQQQLLRDLLKSNEQEFPATLDQLESEVSGLRAQLAAQQKLHVNEVAVRELLNTRLLRLQELQQRQLLSSSDIDAVQTDLLKQDNVLQRIQLEMDATRRSLEKLDDKRRRAGLDHKRELARLRQELSVLGEQKLRMLSKQSIEVASPVNGTISLLSWQQGQIVRSGQVLASVLQDDSTLEAELLVPSRAIGFMEKNLPVSLRFDAFPFRKYGSQPATIKSISSTAIMPSDSSGNSSSREPYYKVIAVLENQSLNAHDGSFQFRPGMRFQANIRLESRSLVQWLLEPLMTGRGT